MDNNTAVAILGYNRKLAWAAIAAVIWALIGLSLALGVAAPPGELRAGLRLGMPEDGVRLRGHIVSLIEQEDGLHIVLAVPKQPPELPELPARLFIEMVTDPQSRRSKPKLELGADSQVRDLPGGRHIAVTTDHILFYGHGDLRIIKRPQQLTGDRLHDWIRRQMDEGKQPRRGMQRRPPPPPPGD